MVDDHTENSLMPQSESVMTPLGAAAQPGHCLLAGAVRAEGFGDAVDMVRNERTGMCGLKRHSQERDRYLRNERNTGRMLKTLKMPHSWLRERGNLCLCHGTRREERAMRGIGSTL